MILDGLIWKVAVAAAVGAGGGDLSREYDAIVKARRAGQIQEAAARFEALANTNPESPIAQRALATAAAIQQWDLEDVAKARDLYDRVLLGPDDAPGVMPALIQRLGIERADKGPRGELALVHRLYDKRPNAAYAPYLLLRAAELLADDLGDRRGALVPLARLRTSFPSSTRTQAATMREAEILRSLGRGREALDLYRSIMGTHSTSLIVGEYDSTEIDDAYFEYAETLRDLNELARAEKAYLDLVEDMPLSRYVDDALFEAARIARTRGDPVSASRYMHTLKELRPASRYVEPRPRPPPAQPVQRAERSRR